MGVVEGEKKGGEGDKKGKVDEEAEEKGERNGESEGNGRSEIPIKKKTAESKKKERK